MLLQLRQRQIQFGDRDVYFNSEGRKMSRLKHVDADWVLRRLERWGKRDNMPFIGPKKVWQSPLKPFRHSYQVVHIHKTPRHRLMSAGRTAVLRSWCGAFLSPVHTAVRCRSCVVCGGRAQYCRGSSGRQRPATPSRSGRCVGTPRS